MFPVQLDYKKHSMSGPKSLGQMPTELHARGRRSRSNALRKLVSVRNRPMSSASSAYGSHSRFDITRASASQASAVWTAVASSSLPIVFNVSGVGLLISTGMN